MVNKTDLDPELLLNKYVIVLYNGQPYLCLVKDVDKEEVYVRCMHSVGRELEKSQFYWPKCAVDECWYSMVDVCEINEPKKVGTRYKVDECVWVPLVKKNDISGVTLIVNDECIKCLDNEIIRLQNIDLYATL